MIILTEHDLFADAVDGEADRECGGHTAQRHHQRVDVHLVIQRMRCFLEATDFFELLLVGGDSTVVLISMINGMVKMTFTIWKASGEM